MTKKPSSFISFISLIGEYGGFPMVAAYPRKKNQEKNTEGRNDTLLLWISGKWNHKFLKGVLSDEFS